MIDTAALFERVRREVAPGELIGLGVCDAAPFPEVRSELERRLSDGSAATLRFTYTDPAVSSDIRRSFPWARRLVVGASAYLPAGGDPGESASGTGRVARFATDDHYRPLRSGLARVAALLIEAGFRAEVMVDDNRLVDRAAAVRAGVGWWGKNAMVLAPGSGPWVLLGSIVTDAPLSTSIPMKRDCGSCSACLPACPTGALVAPGILDARLCIAHWTQAPGIIPTQLRAAMGDRIYGCDDCLDACPPGHRLLGGSHGHAGRHDLTALLGAADRTLLARFPHFYIPQRRARYLRRNALVALGNSGGDRAREITAGFLGHPDWLLRVHAAWAVGRLGGRLARAVLHAAVKREAHTEVSRELREAIEAMTTRVP